MYSLILMMLYVLPQIASKPEIPAHSVMLISWHKLWDKKSNKECKYAMR